MSAPDNEISVSAALPAAETETIMSALFDQLIDKFEAGHTADSQEVDALLDAVLYVLQNSEDYESPEKLAEAIEQTAPKVAQHIRSLQSPDAIAAYINLLTAIIVWMTQLSNALHNPPPPGQTQQVTVNVNVTNAPVNINVTTAPQSPAPDGGATPGQKSH
ncbi:hypothetical protein [Mycobacterium sp. E1747]|uniref:hypothetical protein n=1 Tax=Mycobacterium sp. E1747 TaxID=1834128 RepID=UPI0007FFBFC7|nr:hypothetical protein [Mycobacterium sp. E1747]OBH12088.1 hypothetical protein A5695_17825 [Mycobacterium sp. E1747]